MPTTCVSLLITAAQKLPTLATSLLVKVSAPCFQVVPATLLCSKPNSIAMDVARMVFHQFPLIPTSPSYVLPALRSTPGGEGPVVLPTHTAPRTGTQPRRLVFAVAKPIANSTLSATNACASLNTFQVTIVLAIGSHRVMASPLLVVAVSHLAKASLKSLVSLPLWTQDCAQNPLHG